MSERIRLITDLEFQDEVPVGSSAAEVRFAVDDSGDQWVAKLPQQGDSEIVAEAVSWLLARRVDAPVVDRCGIYVDASGGAWWLSALIPDADHWSAERASRVVNLESLGLALAVDGVVWNADRHERNVLLARATGGGLHAVAIDFGAALAGYPRALRPKGTEPPRPRRLAVGLWSAGLEPELRRGARLLENLSEATLGMIASAACEHVDPREAHDLAAVLEERCRAATNVNADLIEP